MSFWTTSFHQRNPSPATQAQAGQVGDPLDDGRDCYGPLQVLPDLGPGPGRDTLLGLETGQQNQSFSPPPYTFPVGPPGLPSCVTEGLERGST